MKHLLAIAALCLVGFSAQAEVSDAQCVQNGFDAAAAKGYSNLEFNYLEKITGDSMSRINGYRIWFKEPGVSGMVVANANSNCHVFQVYRHW